MEINFINILSIISGAIWVVCGAYECFVESNNKIKLFMLEWCVIFFVTFIGSVILDSQSDIKNDLNDVNNKIIEIEKALDIAN